MKACWLCKKRIHNSTRKDAVTFERITYHRDCLNSRVYAHTTSPRVRILLAKKMPADGYNGLLLDTADFRALLSGVLRSIREQVRPWTWYPYPPVQPVTP